MSEVDKANVENPIDAKEEKELFSFRPIVTTDKKRIAEILAPVRVSSVATEFSELHNENDARFTALGKAVALKLAVKATEYPFVRILHTYKYQTRSVYEYFYNSKTADCAPAPNPDAAREIYSDVWDDKQFNALKRNEHGERVSTCKVIKCPKCQGTGKEYYDDYDTEEEWKKCPNCGGSGKEGIYICKRCEGKGKVLTTVKTKRRRQRTCSRCGGEGSGLSAFLAMGGSDSEVKWERILEHEPKLHSQSDLAYDYSYLKTDASKKAAQIKKIRTISIEGGVIDPKKHNLSKLPLREEDIKRVYDVCYPQQGDHVTAFYQQDKKPDPQRYQWSKDGQQRTVVSGSKYFDEKITITTGIGWVKIDLANGRSFWVDTLHNSAHIPAMKEATPPGKWGYYVGTPLFSVDQSEIKKCRMEDYEPCVQEAIKEAKRDGSYKIKTKQKKSKGSATSAKKRWLFILLGLLLGCFGAHLAYAKRWFLFLMLWGGFITGNVMMSNSTPTTNQEQAQSVEQSTPNQADEKTSDDSESTNMIGGLGLAVWGLLWIGGTIFIKKDGKGNRM